LSHNSYLFSSLHLELTKEESRTCFLRCWEGAGYHQIAWGWRHGSRRQQVCDDLCQSVLSLLFCKPQGSSL